MAITLIAMDTDRKRSRWNYDGVDADTQPVTLSARDIEIFKLLDPERRFTYLPSNWIHHFVGGNANDLSARLGRLSRQPNCYLLRPKQQRASLNADYKHQVYARAPAADRLMIERGLLAEIAVRPDDHYAHRLLTDIAIASIEIGCTPGHEFLSWSHLLAAGIVPEATAASAVPFKIPVGAGHVIPDGRPFAIRRAQKVRFILGFEIDRNTEDLTGKSRSSIQHKLRRYHELFKIRAFKSHYGFPNSLVLFVTTNERHLANIIALTEKEIETPTWALFKHIEDWSSAPRFPPPSGFLFTQPWQRAGNSPLNLGDI